MKTRTCHRCKAEKLVGTAIQSNAKYCYTCRSEVPKERAKKWYQDNPDRAKEYRSKKDVRERWNTARRARPKDHPSRAKERESARKFQKSPEGQEKNRVRAADRRATPEGKAYYRQYVRIRAGIMKNASRILEGAPELKKQVDAIYAEAVRQGMTVDHIYPLNHKRLSGLHVPWNLRIIPLDENRKKNNKLPEEIGLVVTN